MKTILIILVVAFSVISCTKGSEHAVDLEFIIPESYLGVFKITEDKKDGLDVVPINKKVKLEVPDNGILGVKDLSILREWHSPSARYSDGTVIPIGITAKNGDNGVYFFFLWTKTSGETYYFVGKAKDFLSIQKAGPFGVENYMTQKK